MPEELIFQGSGVAIEGRALLIEGPPGAGKSSLALALIDRGATLIGDDGVRLVAATGGAPLAYPPPNIAGLIELRGVGIFDIETTAETHISLILSLQSEQTNAPERLPNQLEMRSMLGAQIPVLPFVPGLIAPGPRAEWALRRHGI
ncbi:MAG: HPr kinase/phosphatase C-terminal domain-containing protein [Pseudomonadota bacterium]